MSSTTSTVQNAEEKLKKLEKPVQSVQELFNGDKNPLAIGNALLKKEETSENFTDTKEETQELGTDVEKDRKKGVLKWVVTGALSALGVSAGKEVLDKDSKERVSDTTAELLSDDAKLKEVNDTVVKTNKEIQVSKEKLAGASSFLGMDLVGDMEKKTETYRKSDFGLKELFGKTWENTAYKDKEQTKRRSWLGRLFTFVPALFFEYGFYSKIKKWENDGTLKKADEYNKARKEIKADAEEAGEKVDEVKKPLRRGIEQSRENVGTKEVKNLIKGYKKDMNKALGNTKVPPKQYAKGLTDAAVKTIQKAGEQKMIKGFIEAVGKGEVPGIKPGKKFHLLQNAGRIPVKSIGIANLINISIMDAIEEGKFSTFTESLTSKEVITEAFVPGVGTWNSIKRANTENSSTTMKAVDIGLNVVGDVVMAAGYIGAIFSGGTTAVAGTAARAGIMTAGRRMLTKQALKSTAKGIAKGAKSGAKLSLLSAPVTIAISAAMKHFKKEKVEQAFVENILTEEQQRSIKITNDVEQDVNVDLKTAA